MKRNKIKGHTLNKKENGDMYGTIKVRFEGKTETIKWRWNDEYNWQMFGAPTEAKCFCVPYMNKIIECFA